MKSLWKILLICVCSLMAVVVVYMTLQDADIDYTKLQAGYSTTGTKGSFYEYKKDDWIDILKRIRVLDENGDPLGNYPYVVNNPNGGAIDGASGGINVSNHNHIAYRQSEYDTSIRISSSCTLNRGGCGWCSLTCAMAELNPSVCGSITPVDWLPIMPDEVRNCWGSDGMGYGAVNKWIEHVNSLGIYGKYSIVESAGSLQPPAVLDKIREYAAKQDCVVIFRAGTGLFTQATGHIMLATDLSSDGSSFHVDDSSGTCNRYLNSANITDVEWKDMRRFDMPLNVTELGGHSYNVTAYWVIRREE